jgi:hypothetical protein
MMNPVDDLEQRIKFLRVTMIEGLDERILADASAALARPRTSSLGAPRSSVWRTIMRNKWARIAAAALVAATVATVMLHRQMTTMAYALEETLEANRGLRSIHIRVTPAGNGLSEAWARFDDVGKLLQLRMSFPNTEDGAKEVVWGKDKAEVWFKTKNSATVVHEPEILKRIPEMLEMFDPRIAMQQIHKAEADGNATVETHEPSVEGKPIELVVTFHTPPGELLVLRVNSETKLIEQLEKYELANGERKLLFRQEYLEYNQQIPPDVFVMDIPADALRVDTTRQEIGLAKGSLSDEEIATKVAREFFEALIAKDYAKAGVIYSGMPAARVREAFGKIDFLRIVSVGEPTPHPDARTHFLQVPCEIEIRIDGQTETKEFVPLIRENYNQPERWSIQGGI